MRSPDQASKIATLWHRLTEPNAAVTAAVDRRRARLAAGLLLVLMPVAGLFAALFAHPVLWGQGEPSDALSIGTLVSFLAAYSLVRSRHHEWGVLLLVLAPLAAILTSLAISADHGPLLYFTAVPVLLGSLLLTFRIAATLAGVNLALAWAIAFAFPQLEAGSLLSPLLFLLTVTPIVLVGAGMLQRSIVDAERANERLQEADAYRLRLLNTIVHDLNTPLTPLSIRVAMLDENSKTAIVMRRNIELMERLISDIADLAKIESDRLRLDVEPADVGAIAAQAAEALQEQAQEQGVVLDVQAPPAQAHVDSQRIMQAFYNLLTNAIKFTPSGGQVAIHVEPRAAHVEARVRDTGRGLLAHEIERLFQPFSQIHDRGESKERGTGLGLFITKAIVEAHGGSVWAHSDGHGKGSTFGFSIPRPTAPE